MSSVVVKPGIRGVNVIAAIGLIVGIGWASSLSDPIRYQVTGSVFLAFAVVMFALCWRRR